MTKHQNLPEARCFHEMTCSTCIVVLNQSKRLQSFPFFLDVQKVTEIRRSAQLRLSSARERWVDWQFLYWRNIWCPRFKPNEQKNPNKHNYLNNLCWVAANQTVQTCFVCGLRFASHYFGAFAHTFRPS